MEEFPFSLLIAVAVQITCQLFKFVYYSIRAGRVDPHYLVTAGGIPSAHTAFVTALTVSIGIRSGFVSDVFAVAAVFSAIVIYDAYRLRGHVQSHAKVLNQLIPAGSPPLSEMVGHSIPEIVAGLLFGGILSAGVTLLIGQ